MAKQFERIEPAHRAMIGGQAIFFVGSAAGDSRVNVSPRSTAHFHVLGDLTVAYLDLTGSGSETAAHAKAGGRATVMFCTFEGRPRSCVSTAVRASRSAARRTTAPFSTRTTRRASQRARVRS